ncbi:hypothetical protein U2261_14770 [Achromobacter xylosoxidans]|jgi:hypothetical protein|uniref:hypothetical protein n=1 Tax=Alcaligenes xylosoxydans xylosoxydans TaxID=85698 RepID=UPI0011B4735E|nr:hypothetical protein [Achromobacter xylosoxidans]MDZ5615878.1 hypothetical protein [Achromobacter xylosoxidans]MDZ5627690.1 hypothetical protein [Achromobacter xylosoxidans]MDZ5687955.1 hypothetical protein [Achromobacter xylosoxidans]
MLSSLSQSLAGSVHHVVQASGKAVLNSGTKLFKPGNVVQQLLKRDYHVVASPTLKNSSGNVTSTGHINFRFTPEEQQRGLPPSLGHVMGPGTPEFKRTKEQVSGILPNGEAFTVMSHSGPGKVSGQDKVQPLCKSSYIDMGDLDDETAEMFKTLSKQPIFVSYETSGKEGKNCVAAVAHVLKQVGIDVQPHMHQTPDGYLQDLSQALGKEIIGPNGGPK